MKGFKIANLITNIIAFLYAFSFCGLVGGLSILELFFGSMGKNDDAILEAVILLLSCSLIYIHGFFLLVFGITSFKKWRDKPKKYLETHLTLSISGIAGTCLIFLLYFTNATGAYDSRIFDIFLFRGEYLILGYTFFCALELILTIPSHKTGNTKQAGTHLE
jgi:hypothetical protein